MLFGLVVIVLSISSEHFLSFRNLFNIGVSSSVLGIAAAGATFVLIAGCIDLSVGAVISLTSMTVASLMQSTGSVVLSIIVGLVVATVCGIINGIIVTKIKVNSLIATLATMAIFNGLAFLWTNGVSIAIANEAFKWIGRGSIGSVPFSVVLLLLLCTAMSFFSKNMRFGRNIYSVGSSEKSSYLSGINIDKVRLGVFTISGFTAGISGIVLVSQTGAGIPQSGQGMEMDILAAAILGGASIKGGKGSVFGSLLGIVFMATLANGLTLLSISSNWQMIAKGILLLVAVFLDSIRTKRLG